MSGANEVIDKVTAAGKAAVAEIKAARSLDDLEKLRVRFLGKNGEITLLSRSMGQVPPESKPAVGKAVNDAKTSAQTALDEQKTALSATTAVRPKTWIDITMPGIRQGVGRRHPLMQTLDEVKSVLTGMGFSYNDWPEVEEEYYNFDSLNTPDWHPSRDMHDSFYTQDGKVLRTHTTAFQVRAMKAAGSQPPIRAMTAGRCYRRDEIDATHFPIFHQVDVLAVDKALSFADLKHTLYTLLRALLGNEIQLRFRPSYFPFTTPSAEVDVFYRGRWMELLGSGMTRPEVLRNGGIDSQQWQGFAFGMGIERLTMARFNIDDIRLINENEEAFLTQF